jgi:Mor family transcriptional regulator
MPPKNRRTDPIAEMVLIMKIVSDHNNGDHITRLAVRYGISLVKARNLLQKGLAYERRERDPSSD